ncbi:rIIA protector from prophage-induced early lysis [Klebsiella phage CPRSA]|nr:rIIA protector from prophage-induced early lysis [Klebsiella phage CPRSA]
MMGNRSAIPLYEIESDEPNGLLSPFRLRLKISKNGKTKQQGYTNHLLIFVLTLLVLLFFKINYQPKEATNDSGVIRHKSAYTSGVYARMGNIIYPLDKDLYDTSMFYCYTESQYTYIIDFPIGELDFMPSREELSMDKMTVGIVKERLKQISRVYFNRVKSEFDKLQTVRDKLTWFHSLPSMVHKTLLVKMLIFASMVILLAGSIAN